MLKTVESFIVQKRYSTLWFLSVLYIGTLIFNFNNKFLESKKNGVAIISMILSIIGYCFIFITKKTLIWNIDLAFFIQIYLCIGYMLAKKSYFEVTIDKIKIIKKFIFYFFSGEVLTIFNYFVTKARVDMFYNELGVYFLSVPAAILCSIGVIWGAKIFKIKFLKFIGENSMVIFLFHQSILMPCAVKIVEQINNLDKLGVVYNFIMRFFELIFVLIVSYILILIINKLSMFFF